MNGTYSCLRVKKSQLYLPKPTLRNMILLRQIDECLRVNNAHQLQPEATLVKNGSNSDSKFNSMLGLKNTDYINRYSSARSRRLIDWCNAKTGICASFTVKNKVKCLIGYLPLCIYLTKVIQRDNCVEKMLNLIHNDKDGRVW